jgi:UDP-glucuronate decarboxylase
MDSPDGEAGPINLGNPAENTILQLAEKVIAMTGSKSTIIMRPLPSDDPRQRNPDIRRAREVLDWTPKVPLEEGLRKTIGYFADLLAEQAAQSQIAAQ